MKSKHANIPIFLPELACPHRCVFCNQSHISSQTHVPTPAESVQIIERNLATIPSDYNVQVAFFGGSFTGLPLQMQESYLRVVQPFIASGRISGVRLSTRPDYISAEILKMLARYHVTDIELGAQSTNDLVLEKSGRGHNRNAIEQASQMIISHDFTLGLQMMIGLPFDDFEKARQTATDIIHFGAKSTRIYPTLVISDTHLAHLYKQGLYQPLSIETAVKWTAELFQLFENHNITVLKVGLHPNEDFASNKYLLAGPYHQSFKELVLSEIWNQKLRKLLTINSVTHKISVFVSPNQINNAIGYHSKNRKLLAQNFNTVNFFTDNSLQNYEFTYCNY